MIYLPEDYYFKYNPKNQNFPYQKAILSTVYKISLDCKYYEAKLLAPKKGVKDRIKQGILPRTDDDKKEFIEKLLGWIWDNSIVDTFWLILSNEKKDGKITNPKYLQYEGMSCCWSLELSEQKFNQLQKVWKNNNLPEDLFFPEDQLIVAIPKYYEKWSKLRRILFSGTYSFSPKKWKELKKTGKDKEYIIQKKNNPV